MTEQEKFMKEALKEAQKAYDKEEIPVGAVIVKEGKIIARGHNLKEIKKSVVNHAEINAINKANNKLSNWRLADCEMYVTLEPCPMCAGAIIQSRIKKVYIGTMDEKTGACGSVLNILEYKFNHQVEVEYGLLKQDCEYILKSFFKNLRKKRKRRVRVQEEKVFNRKIIHTYIIIISIVVVAISIGLIMLRYSVEGERNLPFEIREINIISTAAGVQLLDEQGAWYTELLKKNDIYFYIAKNDRYRRTETIKSVTLDNFHIEKYNDRGIVEIYRQHDTGIYQYIEEYVVTDRLVYTGSLNTNVQELKINNQGGLIGFAVVVKELGQHRFSMNEPFTIDGRVLNEIDVNIEDITLSIYFDITIEFGSGNRFRAEVSFDLPVGNILEQGVEHIRITDLSGMVFRRI